MELNYGVYTLSNLVVHSVFAIFMIVYAKGMINFHLLVNTPLIDVQAADASLLDIEKQMSLELKEKLAKVARLTVQKNVITHTFVKL